MRLQSEPLSKSIHEGQLAEHIAAHQHSMGEELVDYKDQIHSVPAANDDHVAAHRSGVVESSIVHESDDLPALTISPKLIHTVKDGPFKGHRFLIKPYYEKSSGRLKRWNPWPLGGWAEMAHQSLYDAAGLSEFHQKTHISEPTLRSGVTPCLTVSMEPGMKDLARFDSQDKQFGQDADPQFSFSPEFVSNCRMMTVMDFLTNNLDRHAHNVMYNPGTGKGLAIDHGRSFQYNSNFHNKWRDEPKKRGHDSLFLYMATGRGIHVADPETSEALNTIIHGQGSLKEMAHRRLDQLWSPVITDWWHDNSHRVKNAFDAHVGLIKDVGIREHISRNFDARWDYLNQLAEFGPNCIRDDWYAEPIKLHSYTGKWP